MTEPFDFRRMMNGEAAPETPIGFPEGLAPKVRDMVVSICERFDVNPSTVAVAAITAAIVGAHAHRGLDGARQVASELSGSVDHIFGLALAAERRLKE